MKSEKSHKDSAELGQYSVVLVEKRKMPVTYKINDKGDCRLCNKPNDDQPFMVACAECDRWFHLGCVNLFERPMKTETWLCPRCQEIKAHIDLLEKKIKEQQPQTSLAERLIKVQQESTQEIITTLRNTTIHEAPPEAPPREENWVVYLKRQALMELPTFEGAAKEWPRFKNIFETTTEEGAFTNLENLTRLQRTLKGKAAKSVQQLMLNPINVDQIIQRLEENYGRPELIYNELLADLRKIKKENKAVIIELSDALDNLVTNMTAIEKDQYLTDHRLVEDVFKKLPYAMKLKWIEYIQENTDPNANMSLRILSNWLKPFAKTQLLMLELQEPIQRKERVNTHQEKRTVCELCQRSGHLIQFCNRFLRMPVDEKQATVLEKRLCFGCLAPNHMQSKCKSKKTCGIRNCKLSHHRLLHGSKPFTSRKNESPQHSAVASTSRTSASSAVAEPTTPSSVAASSSSSSINYHRIQQKKVYYQIIPVKLINGNQQIETYAFLDAGSSLTLINEDTANQLKLVGREDPLTLKWTQDISREESNSRRVNLHIKGTSDKTFTLKNVRTVKDLQLPIQILNVDELVKQYKHLDGIFVEGYQQAQPTILIGLDQTHLITAIERRIGGDHEPMAIRTKLGWLIYGNATTEEFTHHILTIEEEMEKLITSFASVEDFGVSLTALPPRNEKEIQAEDIFKQTVKKNRR